MKKVMLFVFVMIIAFSLIACSRDETPDPSIVPTDPTVVPTDPTIVPTNPTDPTIVPTDPTIVPTDPTVQPDSVYLRLIQAEDLSGMKSRMNSVIRVDGSLNLPTEYQGVTITYISRVPDIISNEGIVTRPNECWVESRDQQGLSQSEFVGMNDNWPIVIDVILEYQGQRRTAKLLFVVAPREGYTCDKYLG